MAWERNTSTVSGIKADVRAALDETSDNTALISDGDEQATALDSIIEAKICEGIKRVECIAPLRLLDPGVAIPADSSAWITNTADHSGTIQLPADFMRLVYFKMSDWLRPVYKALEITDKEYQYQMSLYGGLQGNYQKPVVAIEPTGQGLQLSYWACRTNNATVTAYYIPLPEIANGSVYVAKRLYEPSIYQIAALVAQSLGDNEAASALQQRSNELINIY